MNKKQLSWFEILSHFDPQQVDQMVCPTCSNQNLQYKYEPLDKQSNVSIFFVWCNTCLEGASVGRQVTPIEKEYKEASIHVPNFRMILHLN